MPGSGRLVSMTSLAELSREHTTLDLAEVDHLNRLTAEWAFLADVVVLFKTGVLQAILRAVE